MVKAPNLIKRQIRRFDSCWMHLERSVQLLLTEFIHIARPDIMYAVQQVCQFMHSPRDTHLQAVKRILRYLKGTINFGISFISTSSSTLTGYVDSDWAGCPDTRRSTMGHCIFLGANPISWSTKKQVTVS